MPVRSDRQLQRRPSTGLPRLTGRRILGLVLLGLGLIATVLSLIVLATR